MQLQKKIKSEQAQNGAASLPCMNARREWNERYGAYIASVHRWRFASLVCAGALIVSVAGNGVQAANEKATVYYVNTEASGRAHEIGVQISRYRDRAPNRSVQPCSKEGGRCNLCNDAF